jgi:type I restriction enzyme S subunit
MSATFEHNDLYENVPVNWVRSKIKYEFDFSKKQSEEPNQEKILSITQRGIVERNIDSNEGQIADSYDKYIKVEVNEISMNPMDLKTGWVDINKMSGLISPAYYTLINLNKNCDTEFINYLFQSNYLNKVFFKYGKGVANHDGGGRWVLSRDILENFEIFVPSIQEQRKIVTYLNQKMELINESINLIEKKISELKIHKKTIINSLIFDNLNEKLKETNSEWLGKIPESWKLKKLKYLADFILSSIDRKDIEEERSVNICHYPDVYNNEIISSFTEISIGRCNQYEFDKFKVKNGDILITKDSETPDDIGIPALINEDLNNTVCGYHLGIIRINTLDLIPEFLLRYIQSNRVKDYFYTESNGVTRYGLGKPSIESLLIPIPSTDIQKNIITAINDKTGVISKLIDNEFSRIKLLKEFKRNTISALVTGKLKI